MFKKNKKEELVEEPNIKEIVNDKIDIEELPIEDENPLELEDKNEEVGL